MLIKENLCLLAKSNELQDLIRTTMKKAVLAFYKFVHLQDPHEGKGKAVIIPQRNLNSWDDNIR